ncbi:hypothetical protein D2962_06215 [Biomaibacter acetigenes]|uniref:Uncharacterized protein n=1 Tax=Biomaibacter acetigenes TaxID=2316383 RepID=A0A3G2R490_9FIRM|nr:DUF6338 family protein [Biomaibacter acetigenes]AYO30266.1 hypothetical protein D2962_06215 [Biomaibacter acetigenes]
MEVKEVIALILFVLPGILAEKISYKMDFPSSDKRSDFNEIVNGMLLSLPIVVLTGVTMARFNDIKTIKEFINALGNIMFLLKYSLLVVLIAIATGTIKGLSGDNVNFIINKVRSWNKKMNIDDKSCWRQVFLEENVPRYVKIIKDGIVLGEGFAKHYSLPNEDMGIVLEEHKDMEYYNTHHPEYKEYLKLCKTYINIEKGVIVEVYDTKEVEKYLMSLSESNK